MLDAGLKFFVFIEEEGDLFFEGRTFVILKGGGEKIADGDVLRWRCQRRGLGAVEGVLEGGDFFAMSAQGLFEGAPVVTFFLEFLGKGVFAGAQALDFGAVGFEVGDEGFEDFPGDDAGAKHALEGGIHSWSPVGKKEKERTA